MADSNDNSNVIWANVSITKQLQQYEPIKIEAGARKVVKDTDDASEWSKLWTTIEEQLEQQIKDIFPGNNG